MRKVLTVVFSAVLFATVIVADGDAAFARMRPEARDLPPEITALIHAGDLDAALAAADMLDRKPWGGYGLIWPTSLVFRDYARLHGPGPVLDFLCNIQPGDGKPNRPDWLRLRAAHIFAVTGMTEEALAVIALIGDPATKDEANGRVGVEIAVDRNPDLGFSLIGAVQDEKERLRNYLWISAIGLRKLDGRRLAERAYLLALNLARTTNSGKVRDWGFVSVAVEYYMERGQYDLAKSLITEIGNQETRDRALYRAIRAGTLQYWPIKESVAMVSLIESPEVRSDAQVIITIDRLHRNMLDDVVATIRLLETVREQDLELATWMSEVVLMSKSRTERGEVARKLHVLGGEIADREIKALAYGCGTELFIKKGEFGWAYVVARLGNAPFNMRTALYQLKRRAPPRVCIKLNNMYN